MLCLETDRPVLLANLLFDLRFLSGENASLQFVMGRSSTVCSALSTSIPQGIGTVSWSNRVDCRPAGIALQ